MTRSAHVNAYLGLHLLRTACGTLSFVTGSALLPQLHAKQTNISALLSVHAFVISKSVPRIISSTQLRVNASAYQVKCAQMRNTGTTEAANVCADPKTADQLNTGTLVAVLVNVHSNHVLLPITLIMRNVDASASPLTATLPEWETLNCQ